jgi:hypothetical protein
MKLFNSFEEAVEYSKSVLWEVKTCPQGPKCWCRSIQPKEPIQYKFENHLEDVFIAESGFLQREYAEYIVELHNNTLKDR